MAGGGSKPGERRGGRKKGTINKATAERLERQRVAERIAAAAGHPGAGHAVAKAMDTKTVWAKDEIAAVVPILKSIMAFFTNPLVEAAQNGTIKPKAEWDHARTWIELFLKSCTDLAPYQSPTFRAIAVTSDVVDKGGVVRFVVENAPVMIEAVANEPA